MATNTLTITDNRTGKKYEIPVQDGGVILEVNRRLFKIIGKVGTGRRQCEAGAEWRDLIALTIKGTEHQVVLVAKVMIQFEVAVVTVADRRDVTEKVAYLEPEVRLGYATRPQGVNEIG